MCSGICPRSLAACKRILTLSFMCFWPIYSSKRVGRKVWSKKESSDLLAPPWLLALVSLVILLDIDLIICYTTCMVHLSTGYQQGYQHYSICRSSHIVKCI